MLFNSIEFILVFLPTVLGVFFMLGRKGQAQLAIWWLILSSGLFYAWWNPKYLVLLFSSLITNFFIGQLLAQMSQKRLILSLGIIANLTLLAYFKYVDFFLESVGFLINHHFTLMEIVLPLAISFFTFQQIAYLVDVYKGRVVKHSFSHYTLFVIFFPQLIAGPIVHQKEMLIQFTQARFATFDVNNISLGFFVFSIGLFKKVVIADGIANYSNNVFNAAEHGFSPTFFEAWGGAFAYSFQLYFDFSGYADMAIGLARMFGIILPVNFNSPYKANSIIDFWRSWHMTLSRFLKDYLYVPLGGNRRGSRYVNLMITMLLGGLWHGASLNFVLWGGLHGIYLIVNNVWRSVFSRSARDNNKRASVIAKVFSVFLTFVAVSAAWVLFRAESMQGANTIYLGMLGQNGFVLPSPLYQILVLPLGLESFFTLGHFQVFGSLTGFVWIVSLIPLVFIMPNLQSLLARVSKNGCLSNQWEMPLAVFCGILFFISLKTIISVVDKEFIYFNF